jgi:hypothetical protein
VSDRRVDGFVYGLYMDLEILREAGVTPSNPRRAFVEDFALRIGQRATLLPSAGASAYGMFFALTHAELERLYTAPGLEQYRPEAVLARSLGGTPTAALCYNLREARDPRSAIRTTPSVFGALSASSTFRWSTSPPWRERGAGLGPYRR